MQIFVLFIVARWSKMVRQRLESSGIDVLSVEARNPDTYGNTVVWSSNITAIPIPIQQNNSVTHFLSYNSYFAYGGGSQDIRSNVCGVYGKLIIIFL